MDITPDLFKKKLDYAIQEAVRQHYEENEMETSFSRKRSLDIVTMIKLLLLMQGGSLNKELHRLNVNATVSAFSQQRKKLSSIDLENVFENFNNQCIDEKKYKGYRVLAVDGTVINMPRNPNAESFVCHRTAPDGYCQMHATPLYDLLNKTYLHCVIQPQPKQDEIGALLFMLQWYDFTEKTLIIADRGFESYNVMATLLEKNLSFVIRVKQERTAMREVAKLPMEELDVDIEFVITNTQTKVDKENGYIFIQTHRNKNRVYSKNTNSGRWDFDSPYPMRLRIVRFQLENGRYETLCTNLGRGEFSKEEFKTIYSWRWGVEISFRSLKYVLNLTHIHTKSDEGVKMEIYAALTMSNFANRIISLATIEQNEDNEHIYAINQKMAIQLCKEFYGNADGDGEKLLECICKYKEPVREGRKAERKLNAKSFVGFGYRVPS